MRYNGLALVINKGVEQLGDPWVSVHRRAMILGAIREDVVAVPGTGRVVEHLSPSHFFKPPLPGGFIPFLWPGARYKAKRYFARACREEREGRSASAFVQLGRAAHLLIDMACPVHVHRKLHLDDHFEWYVDAHRGELEALPIPEIEPVGDVVALITQMAAFTAQFPADGTQHHVGRFLKRRGLLKAVPGDAIREHARAIIPVACAHMVELLRLFRDQRSGR